MRAVHHVELYKSIRYHFLNVVQKKRMHYSNLAFQLIHSDIIKFSQSNRREGTMLRCTNLTFKRFNQMSFSPQSNIKGKSNMLSYPTERPLTSYRIKIISRRYRSISTPELFSFAHDWGRDELGGNPKNRRHFSLVFARNKEHTGNMTPLSTAICRRARRAHENDTMWTSSHSSTQKKSHVPHPGTQILSQTPEGGEGNRGQMPHVCPGSPPVGLNIDRCIKHEWLGSECW